MGGAPFQFLRYCRAHRRITLFISLPDSIILKKNLNLEKIEEYLSVECGKKFSNLKMLFNKTRLHE